MSLAGSPQLLADIEAAREASVTETLLGDQQASEQQEAEAANPGDE